MNEYVLFLTDAKSAVCGLVFHCWIPPAIKMDNLGCLCQVDVGAEYRTSIGRFDVVTRADYFWQDDYYANEFNKPSDEMEGWEQLNAKVTVRPTEGSWQVMAYVKNALGNEDEIRMNQEGPLVGRVRSVSVMEPLTYGVELRMDF